MKDITGTPLRVYRIYGNEGELCGYALNSQEYEEQDGVTPEEITSIDPEIDTAGRLEIHVFPFQGEAQAFREGLIAASDESYAYNIEHLIQAGAPDSPYDGWAVLRECTDSPTEGLPSIAVFTYETGDWRKKA